MTPYSPSESIWSEDSRFKFRVKMVEKSVILLWHLIVHLNQFGVKTVDLNKYGMKKGSR